MEIGAYCSMAWDAEILVDPGAWPADDPGPPDRSRLRVVLGHDVWLTRMAKVLGGVTVGTGAIIANGAVVTEDVRPYAIVAGNPAREVGRRFTDEQVEGLLEVAWWDWPEATVRERYAELCSDDIDGFLARHRPGKPAWPWPLTGAGSGPACAVRRPAASGGWATGSDRRSRGRVPAAVVDVHPEATVGDDVRFVGGGAPITVCAGGVGRHGARLLPGVEIGPRRAGAAVLGGAPRRARGRGGGGQPGGRGGPPSAAAPSARRRPGRRRARARAAWPARRGRRAPG